jgi:hypothetical protein
MYSSLKKSRSGKPLINLGAYESRQSEVIQLLIRDLWSWTWHICEPIITLHDVTGYLGRYGMVKLREISIGTGNQELGVEIFTKNKIQCITGYSNENYFRIRATI